MTGQDFLKYLKENRMIIYGSGFVAEIFYCALKRYNLTDQIDGYVVTSLSKAEMIHGFEVKEYDAADTSGKLICLAVHESVKDQIQIRESDESVWIYPFLYDLLYGEAIEKKQIQTRELLTRQDRKNSWITLRYCGLLGIEKNNQELKDLYVDCLSLHCSRTTAERRLQELPQLLNRIRTSGFNEKDPILIDQDYKVIDGLHRIAIAVYLGIRELPCLIYPVSEVYEEVLQDRNRLNDAYLQEKGMNKELRLLQEQKKEMLNRGLISVILPVYNVADYIDQCMNSLVQQTYRNLQIILVNDGSTDNSLNRCLFWKEKDERVEVISQENRGVAAARNTGIDAAKGKYLCFVDPDDWVETDYCEKLLEKLLAEDCDYVECDLWRYDNRSGKKIYRANYGKMGMDYTLQQHMKYGATATYKALSRKALWDRYHIRMPECSFESPAIYSLLLALSNKTANVKEALYYYRRFREDSLIENGYAYKDGSSNNTLAIEAMRFLISEFKRCGIYERYQKQLEGIVKYRLSDILAMQYHRKSRQDFQQLRSNYDRFLLEAFPDGISSHYLLYGGYNLNRIMQHLDILQDPDSRLNFSSIISLLKKENRFSITHSNRYRQIMVNRELKQEFRQLMNKKDPEYLFMDLIEERFDILDTGESYITLSDAFEKIEERDAFSGRIISRNSLECERLWKKAFDQIVKECKGKVRIIVVENYLSEKIGNISQQKNYPEIQEIRQTNAILRNYYDYIRKTYPDIPTVKVSDLPLYFTDEKYEYGAIPSHLNEPVNMEIASRIMDVL